METPNHIKNKIYDAIQGELKTTYYNYKELYFQESDLIQIQRNELLAHQNELLKQLIDVLHLSTIKSKPLTGKV